MRREWLICLALIVITLIAFWPAGHLGFILYDDYGKNGYIVDNTNIQAGITFESIRWAFTTTQASNWHPVTWLSHMLDCQLFGLKPSGPHWVNLGFHILNTLLLFVVLREMMGLRRDDPQQPYDSPPRNANKTANAVIAATTPQAQAVWRSALVAALFALHPTHIQSVAWISERKDVLSAFFFLLTLWAYARYVEKSKVQSSKSKVFYGLALGFFALGLMSKPMLVTVPVILLLLDFWPLGRISEFGVRSSDLKSAPHFPMLRRLIWEKAPFLTLSLASSVVTFCAQGVSVVPLDYVSWDSRIENALAAYTAYLGKTFWPENLSIFYPYTQIRP